MDQAYNNSQNFKTVIIVTYIMKNPHNFKTIIKLNMPNLKIVFKLQLYDGTQLDLMILN